MNDPFYYRSIQDGFEYLGASDKPVDPRAIRERRNAIREGRLTILTTEAPTAPGAPQSDRCQGCFYRDPEHVIADGGPGVPLPRDPFTNKYTVPFAGVGISAINTGGPTLDVSLNSVTFSGRDGFCRLDDEGEDCITVESCKFDVTLDFTLILGGSPLMPPLTITNGPFAGPVTLSNVAAIPGGGCQANGTSAITLSPGCGDALTFELGNMADFGFEAGGGIGWIFVGGSDIPLRVELSCAPCEEDYSPA